MRALTEDGVVARLSPSGKIAVTLHPDAPSVTDGATARRVADAFERGTGHGLLQLGAVEVDALLPASLGWWRELGRAFVAGACLAVRPAAPERVALPAEDPALFARLAAAVPPMRGGELVNPELLRQHWGLLGEALTERAAEHQGGLQGYLEASHALWHVAGRVCLHLAENKQDPDFPFAFIATYARPRPDRAEVQHVPLSRALQEYAGARQKEQLLALLTPLQRAAQESPVIRELVGSGAVYHPLAWTTAEAYAFLREVPSLTPAGVVVRLPDWWTPGRPTRPRVQVTVGEGAPSALGLSGLLDFDVRLTLGGEVLTDEELAQLLAATEGLALIRGRWVEVDPEQLSEVLDRWRQVQRLTAQRGLSFAEAMRLLAGAGIGASDEDGLDARPEWSEVVAGRWLQGELDRLRDPQVSARIDRGAGLQATLRPYQRVGVQWLWTLYQLGLGGFLADDMGLGKTIQVIGLLSLLHQDEAGATDLLVVPASLVDNWESELARFAPHLRVLVAHPSRIPTARLKALPDEEIGAHQVVITTYGTALRTPWVQERPWRVVALDEAQAIKNPSARQTRAVKSLPSRWRLALTGTPVENRLSDLWSLSDFLNPGLLGSAKAFGDFSKGMAKRPGDGYAPLRRLIGPYILRRLKSDRRIISDLPDKTEVKTWCLLSKPQAALYRQAVNDLSKTLQETASMERRGAVLAALNRFKQICNHPSQWLADGDYDPAHSGKFQRLTELCEPIRARQEKVLIFTQFRTLTDPLARHLAEVFGRPGLTLHGGTPVKQRAALVERFQQDEDVPFMVLSLKAGGTGLNLTAANHVIHFDRWWNPAVENQATDRAFRIGQHRNVLVHKFVCQGTLEERIDQLIDGKRRLARDVLTSGGEPKLTELTNEELMDLVALDMNKAVVS
ncbi:MAG: DEAD/DEAH box helicase [Deltaproteobacteria bacterium]|nr:DEAD/DEAH box helicase [Deltaproteobacteria bacterium]